MKRKLRKAALLLAGLAPFGVSGLAQASSAELVLHLFRTVSCVGVVDNEAVLTAEAPSLPGPGQSITITGPDGQQFSLTVGANGDTLQSWEILDPARLDTAPVEFALVETRDDSNMFHYGDTGALKDTELSGPGGPLASVKLCYGSVQDNLYVGDCDELARNGETLNGTEVACPDDEARMIISLDVTPGLDPDDRPDFNRRFCSCNLGRLPTCDPDLSRSETDDNDACTNNPDGRNERPPMSIEGVENPGSYLCFTIGGSRVCYGHF